jgi:hypothetical protein
MTDVLEVHARMCDRRRTRQARADFAARCIALEERVAVFGPSRPIAGWFRPLSEPDRILELHARYNDRLADEQDVADSAGPGPGHLGPAIGPPTRKTIR